MTICSVDGSILESAFNSGLTDFENAIQIFCAVTVGLDDSYECFSVDEGMLIKNTYAKIYFI